MDARNPKLLQHESDISKSSTGQQKKERKKKAGGANLGIMNEAMTRPGIWGQFSSTRKLQALYNGLYNQPNNTNITTKRI